MTDLEYELIDQQASMLEHIAYLEERMPIGTDLNLSEKQTDEEFLTVALFKSLYMQNRTEAHRSLEDIQRNAENKVYQDL